jgi:hypothetical protein
LEEVDRTGWSLPYPSCAAEEQEYEGDYDEDAPAGHCCMRFGVMFVVGRAMCKGSPWGGWSVQKVSTGRKEKLWECIAELVVSSLTGIDWR